MHPTLLTLAGVPLPTDRIIDGLDLTPLITNQTRATQPLIVESADPLGRDRVGGHTCIFYYLSAVASNASDPDALSAVRCGSHKAYWFTNGVEPPAPYKGGLQDPPLLFDVEADVGEDSPIAPGSSEYTEVMAVLTAARSSHLATITPVPNQNARGANYTYTACSDFNSKTKFPKWPECTLSPATWQPAEICSDTVCVDRFKLANACAGPK